MRASEAKQIADQMRRTGMDKVLKQISVDANRGQYDTQYRQALVQEDVDQLRDLGYHVTNNSQGNNSLYLIRWD